MRFTKTFFRPLTVALSFCAAVLCRAQVPLSFDTSIKSIPPYRLLTVNEGLPQGLVRDMVQDRQGFIWLATEGLCRYDGRAFFRYRHVFGDSSSLLSDNIQHLELDDKDNLWIGYFSEASGNVDVLNTVTGRIRHLSKEPAFRWLKELAVRGPFFIRQTAGSYFAVSNYFLIGFDPTTGRHEEIPLPAGEKLTAIGGNSLSPCPLSTTKALYQLRGTRLHTIVRYPPVADNVFKIQNEYFSGATIGKILPDKKSAWIITAGGGIYIYRPQTGRCNYVGNPLNHLVPNNLIQAADTSVYMVLGTGIFRLTERDELQLFCKSPFQFFNPLLLADHSGVLWASVDVHGLCLYDLRPPNFRSAPVKRGFADDVLNDWLRRPADSTWYASYGLRSAKDQAGRIWVLNREGFAKPNGSSAQRNRLFAMGSRTPPVVFEDILFLPTNIAFDQQSGCWLTFNNLRADSVWLVKADLQQGRLSHFATLKTNWPENSYLTAAGSKLCYLNDDGLWLFDRQTTARTAYSKEALGIGGSLLMAVPDAKDEAVLWIATKGSGILRFNTATGEKKAFTEADGLPNNTVYFIAPDKKGFFWCSSNKGLFRFEPRSGKVASFTVKDGLQGNEFNRYHFLETPDGRFLFGGTAGTTVFHPDSVYIDDYNPPVALTGIAINNTPLQQADAKWKDVVIPSLTNLTLAYNQNFLGFNFAGLQYNAPEKLHYRYRLRGLHDDWLMAGYDASARYAALPPGHYVFQVNASNTAGVWSNPIGSLSITVLPPWWRMWWVYFLYALLAAGGAYAIYLDWIKRVKAKQQLVLKEKEAAQAQAMEELKSRFFANITHELRTPLTLILSPVQKQLAAGGTAAPPELLQGVYQNSKTLLHLINQLLDMGKLEAGRLPVTLSRGNLGLFIDGLQKAFRPQAELKSIRFTYTHPQSEEECLFDSDKLEKILFNLLGNAFKFTPDGGSIGIELKLREESAVLHTAVLSVTDTGIGIAPEHLPQVFNRFYQVNTSATRKYEGTGIGLSLVKELAELMGGRISAESTEGGGSTFTLTLPMAVAQAASSVPEVTYAATEVMLGEKAPVASSNDTDEEALPVVLVADDNEGLRRFIRSSLAPHYRVITAANGREALEIADAEIPDLILSDVMMPEMDGYELCEKIKAAPLTSHIGFVMLTAKQADESRMSGLRLGADHYLGKPFIVEELLLTVSNLLKRQQTLREFYAKQLQPSETLPRVAEVGDSFLRQVYTVIETHLDSEALDVEFLASALAVSRRTLNRKLSAVADTSANEIIRNYRLKKAAGLLLAGQNVSEAAYATGFSTPSWFTQCFKELYGLTPVQWTAGNGLS